MSLPCLRSLCCWLLASGLLVAAEVGVLWVDKSGMAQRVARGLIDGLKQGASDILLEFKSELPNNQAATILLDRWQEEKQAVICLRSPGATLLAAYGPRIPAFIGACSDPVTLGVVPDLQQPGGMITGVTYYLPAEQRLQVFREAFPNMQSVGLIVDNLHPSAAIDLNETAAACQVLGLRYQEARCESDVDILKAAKDMAGSVDLIVLGSQAKIATQATRIAGITGNTPMAAYNATALKGNGAVIGLHADDVKLGHMLAQSLIAVLRDGQPVGSIPIKTDPDPQILINPGMLAKLGISLPDSIMARATTLE